MKQTVEEAAREHQTHFEICDAEGTINGFINFEKNPKGGLIVTINISI